MQHETLDFYINCFITLNLLLQIVSLTLVSYIAASVDELIINKAKFDEMISKMEAMDYSDMPKLVSLNNQEDEDDDCSSISNEESENENN